MNSTSLVVSIADVVGLSGKAPWNTKMQSHELSGPCPFGCGVSTAFHVYPDMNEIPGVGCLGHFLCMDSNKGGRAGCGRCGNMIDLVMERDRLDFDQACTTLGINADAVRMYRKDQKVRKLMEEQKGLSFENACHQVYAKPEEIQAYRKNAAIPVSHIQNRIYRNNARLAETSEEWQVNAYALARVSNAKLGLDERVKQYLSDRGITTEVIKENHYGLYDQYKWVNAALWGYRQSKDAKPKRMVIPRGIVIPWMDEDYTVRCIRIRRLPWDESEEASHCYGVNPNGERGRYTTLYGVSTERLYNDHLITPGCKVALFEGEFTSVVAQAACKGQGIVCIATGSTAWGFNEKNIRLLASCEKVLICFDADNNRAGDKASKRWLDRLSNAARWRPLWDDANDMAMDGVDVGAWLALGFEEESQSDQESEAVTIMPVSNELSVESSSLPTITEETALCSECLSADEPIETPASFVGPDDIMYCKSHYDGLPSQIYRADMNALAERYRRALPGWKVTVEAR